MDSLVIAFRGMVTSAHRSREEICHLVVDMAFHRRSTAMLMNLSYSPIVTPKQQATANWSLNPYFRGTRP